MVGRCLQRPRRVTLEPIIIILGAASSVPPKRRANDLSWAFCPRDGSLRDR